MEFAPVILVELGILPDDALVVELGPGLRVPVVDHFTILVILGGGGGIKLQNKTKGTNKCQIFRPLPTFIGPSLLSLFLEGLFFFLLIPPAILALGGSRIQRLCKMGHDPHISKTSIPQIPVSPPANTDLMSSEILRWDREASGGLPKASGLGEAQERPCLA